MTLPKLAASLIIATVLAAVLGGCAYVERRANGREAGYEAAYPPTGRFVTVAGRRIHAHVEGRGPDLVMIHGASGNTRDFTFALAGRLAQDYRVIAFDRPGLGWSDPMGDAGISPVAQADALRAAAAELGVRRPIVLGHSYGGAVAMAWALRDPGRTAGLVLVSAATMPWPGGLGAWYGVSSSKIGAATVIPLITAFAPEDRADEVLTGIFAPQAPPPGYAEYIGAGLTLRRDSLRTNARQVAGLKAYLTDMSKSYDKLTLPVEIIHGTADTIVPLVVHSQPLALLLPNANLVKLDGAGHMPHHTHAPAVIAAVDRAATRAGLR